MNLDHNLPRIKAIIVNFVIQEINQYIESEVDYTIENQSQEEIDLYEFATDVLTEFIPDDTSIEDYPSKDSLLEWAEEIYPIQNQSESDIEDDVILEIDENFDDLFDEFLSRLLKNDQGWMENIDGNDFNKIVSESKKETLNYINNYLNNNTEDS